MQKRNYGLDFLRIFAMFLVVVDHTILSNLHGIPHTLLSPQYISLRFLYMISLWCNILFGMVSGYLMYTKRPKAHRVFEIWLEVFFYSVVCFLILTFVYHVPVTYSNLANAIFPIMRVRYWYLTAYFEMLIFVPILNLIVRKIPRETAIVIMVMFFVIVITLPLFLKPQHDPFSLRRGKNVWGLMIFYLMGAFIRKFDLDKIFSKSGWWLTVLITLILNCLSRIGITLLNQKHGWHLTTTLLTKNASLSPTALAGAFAIFCIFKNVHFNEHFHGLLKTFSAASLAVYLIHWALYPVLQYKMMIAGRLVMNPVLLGLRVLLIVLIIDLMCSIIDIGRLYLFKLLHVRSLANYVGDKFEKMLANLKAKIEVKSVE